MGVCDRDIDGGTFSNAEVSPLSLKSLHWAKEMMDVHAALLRDADERIARAIMGDALACARAPKRVPRLNEVWLHADEPFAITELVRCFGDACSWRARGRSLTRCNIAVAFDSEGAVVATLAAESVEAWEKSRARPKPAVGQRWTGGGHEIEIADTTYYGRIAARHIIHGQPAAWTAILPDADGSMPSGWTFVRERADGPGVLTGVDYAVGLSFNGIPAPTETLPEITRRRVFSALSAAFRAVAEAMQTERGGRILNDQLVRDAIALCPAGLEPLGWFAAVHDVMEGPMSPNAWMGQTPRELAEGVRSLLGMRLGSPICAYDQALAAAKAKPIEGPWTRRAADRRRSGR